MNDEIDRMLSSEDSIVPSSGFAVSVMEAVRRDAEAPPPIPFPWTRALPGLVSCVGALVALLIVGFLRSGPGAELPNSLNRVTEVAGYPGVGWIAMALVVSLVSVILSLRVAGRRTF